MNFLKDEGLISRQKALLDKYYKENQFTDFESLNAIRGQIRKKHEENLKNELNNIYHQIDIDRLFQTDWFIRRFLVANHGDLDKTIHQLDKCLKWRKEFDVNNLIETDIPAEFIQAGALFPYAEDKSNRLVIYIRIKVYKKAPKLGNFFRKFFIGVIDKVDQIASVNGYILVFDFGGAGLSNVDMEFIQFMFQSLNHYYPEGMKLMVAHNFPKLLQTFWVIAKNWMSSRMQNLLKFTNGDDIKNLIAEENLPKYLGGKSQIDFTEAPQGCRTIFELGAEANMTDKEVEKHYKMFEESIEEAKRLGQQIKEN